MQTPVEGREGGGGCLGVSPKFVVVFNLRFKKTEKAKATKWKN